VEECLQKAYDKIEDYLLPSMEMKFCCLICFWRHPKIILPWIEELKKTDKTKALKKLMDRALHVSTKQKQVDVDTQSLNLPIKPTPKLVHYCQKKFDECVSSKVADKKVELLKIAMEHQKEVLSQSCEWCLSRAKSRKITISDQLSAILQSDGKKIEKLGLYNDEVFE